MMTVREYLMSVTGYPIPPRTIEAKALKRGLSLDGKAADVLGSDSLRLALADLYVWLYFAPNVGQGGQSYSFTDSQREWWRRQAMQTYEDLKDDELSSLQTQFGYMGRRL